MSNFLKYFGGKSNKTIDKVEKVKPVIIPESPKEVTKKVTPVVNKVIK